MGCRACGGAGAAPRLRCSRGFWRVCRGVRWQGETSGGKLKAVAWVAMQLCSWRIARGRQSACCQSTSVPEHEAQRREAQSRSSCQCSRRSGPALLQWAWTPCEKRHVHATMIASCLTPRRINTRQSTVQCSRPPSRATAHCACTGQGSPIPMLLPDRQPAVLPGPWLAHTSCMCFSSSRDTACSVTATKHACGWPRWYWPGS